MGQHILAGAQVLPVAAHYISVMSLEKSPCLPTEPTIPRHSQQVHQLNYDDGID